MKKDASRFWLSNNRRNATGKSLDARTVSSKLSNCRTVERYEGDLDFKFDQDHHVEVRVFAVTDYDHVNPL